MKKIVNIFMYLSAFLPMLIVLWLKEIVKISIDIYDKWQVSKCFEWKKFLNMLLIIELCVIISVIFCFFMILRSNRERAVKPILINQASNQTAEYYLSYFSLFILSMIGFSLGEIIDVILLCLLFILLGIVYIRNNLYYINPTVNIFNSYIYKIKYKENDKYYNIIIISKDKLYSGETINIYNSEYDFSFVKEKVVT